LRDDRLGFIYHDVTQIFDLGSRRPEPDDGLREGVSLARVPAVLERELRRVHEALRQPVSNIMRAVIEDAVAVADHAGENVEARLKTLASSLEHEREKLRRRIQRDPLEGVFAFQSIKLAQPVTCAKCTKDLRRGETAHLGLRDEQGAPRVFVCEGCVPNE
jgi:hypothetical protein